MMLILLQIVAVVAVALYLVRWAAGQRRRQAQSWETLIGRLRLDGRAGSAGALSFARDGGACWTERLQAARGVWTMFCNAGVLLEMADYAARNGACVDAQMLAEMRTDALLTRLYALRALAGVVLSTARDAATMHALRAQAAYAEMALRVTEMLETGAEEMVPGFVAAM